MTDFANGIKNNNSIWKRRLIISKTVVFFVFLFFPFIQQRTMEELPSYIVLLYRGGALLSSTLIYLGCIIWHRIIPKKEIILFAVYWLIYIFSTLIHCPSNLVWVAYNSYTMFALVLFIFVRIQDKPMEILKSLTIIYVVFICLNWVLDIFFPNGLYTVSVTSYHTAHLLGDDNAIVYVALPGLVISTCYSIINNRKISWLCYFMMAITEITLIKVWSVSAMLVVGAFIILIIYVCKVKEINYKFLVFVLVLTIIMAFYGLSSTWFQDVIVNGFHKSITLSGRTIVWKGAFEMIKSRPLLGYGGYYQMGRFAVNARRSYSAHTPYLQIIIDGGFMLLSVFIMIVWKSFSKMKIEKNNLVMYSLGIGATCMMINYITEQVVFFHLFIILSLMINIDYLPRVEKSNLKKSIRLKSRRGI